MKVNLMVLNYNGEKLISECMPSIIIAKKASKHSVKITVIDNESSDNSLEVLKEFGPEIEVIKHRNECYCSFNDIARQVDDDIIILLNNDIKVSEDYIDPLIEPFQDRSDVLFVAAKGYSFDGTEYQGDRSIASMKRGYIEPLVHYSGYEKDMDSPGYVFSAGIGAFDRKKFIELEGYDHIYLPGRVEDVDLCYRGWKKGYVGIYQPLSVHYHKGGSSFNEKYSSRSISIMVFKNSIVFMGKNITDPLVFFKFLALLFCGLGYYTVTGRWFLWKGFLRAVKIIPRIIERRKVVAKEFVLKDREVLMKNSV